MTWQYHLFILPLLIASALCAAVSLYSWNRRQAPGAVALSLTMLATAAHTSGVALGLASRDLHSAMAWWRAVFLPATLIWPAWLVFALEYSGQQRWLTRRNLWLLAVVPLITMTLALTNGRHHLVAASFTQAATTAGPTYMWTAGPWFYVHLVFSDACAVAGSVALARWSMKVPRSYRAHVSLLLVGALAPLLARLLTVLGGGPANNADLSAFALPLTGLAWAYGLERFGLYGVVPLARESMFRTLTDGAIVLDLLGRVADGNPALEAMLGQTLAELRGQSVRQVFPQWPLLLDVSRPLDRHADITVAGAGGQRTLEARLSPLYANGRRFAGHIVTLRDVSEVRRTQEALDRANRQSEDILASISDGFLALSEDLTITYFNKAAATLLGRSAEDVLGRNLFDAFPCARELEESCASAFQARRPLSIEVHVDEEPLRNWYDLRVYPSDRGVAVYFQVTTERRAALDALRSSEEKFRGVVEQSRDGIVLADERGRIVEWNAGQEEITAIPREQALGRLLWEVQAEVAAHAESLGGRTSVEERAAAAFWRLVGGASPRDAYEASTRRPDGSVRRMQSRVFPIRTSTGLLVGSINRDVTEQREAEQQRTAMYRIVQATAESDDLQQLYGFIHEAIAGLLSADNFAIALHDRDTGLVSFPYMVDSDCAPPEARRDGRGRTEHVLRTGEPLLADEAALKRMVASGAIEAEGTMARSYLGVPLRGSSGVIGVMAVQCHRGEPYTEAHRDLLAMISGQVAMAIERKRAEDAVRRHEAQLASLMNAMAAGIIIVQDDKCCYANAAMEAIAGYKAEQLLGRRFWEIVHPDDRTALEQRAAARRAGVASKFQYEARIVRQDGELRWLAAVSVMVEFAGAPATLVSAIDITERKRLQEQVIASQRLSVLGTVAAGVAHELNSPLQVITGLSQTLSERLAADTLDHERLRRGLGLIERNAWHCADIVAALLTCARPSSPSLGPVDLNAVVRETMLLVEHQLRSWSGIVVETRLEEGLPLAVCNANQMVQVLTNLLTNAHDATLAGGTIVVSTTTRADGGEVLLQVEDNGIGMDEQVRARIFDPFFTTKEPGAGTGLGLWLVSGIVHACGGEIAVDSDAGAGTRFTIAFPLADADQPTLSIADEGGRYDCGDDG